MQIGDVLMGDKKPATLRRGGMSSAGRGRVVSKIKMNAKIISYTSYVGMINCIVLNFIKI